MYIIRRTQHICCDHLNLFPCIDPSVPPSQLYLDHHTLSLAPHRKMAFGDFVPSMTEKYADRVLYSMASSILALFSQQAMEDTGRTGQSYIGYLEIKADCKHSGFSGNVRAKLRVWTGILLSDDCCSNCSVLVII